MYFKFIVLILSLFLTLANCKLENPDTICNVKEVNSSSVKPCDFPFMYKEVTYHGCTLKDGDGQPWCSTKKDPLSLEHQEGTGLWGDCLDSNCIQSRDAIYSFQNARNIEMDLIMDSLSPPYETDEEILTNCKCQTIESCSWSNNVVEAIKGLNQNHDTFRSLNKYFKSRNCEDGKVFCCNDKTSPTIPQLRVLKNDFLGAGVRGVGAPLKEIDSGKWLPEGKNSECGVRSFVGNIVGGKQAKLGDFPYMALIGYDTDNDGKTDGYRCGGSLINKWYVLTAAHCIDTDNGRPAEIVLGEHKIFNDPDCPESFKGDCPGNITRTAAKFIVHENYNNPKKHCNDIALIRLNKPVPLFNENPKKSLAMPICLPNNVDDPVMHLHDDEKVVVTGWGKTANAQSNEVRAFSKILRRIQLPIANHLCTQPPYEIDESIQICAGGVKRRDSCNADSGGPMVYRELSNDPWYQAGIVSFGSKRCGTKGQAAVYTKVSAFVPWIISKLEN